jgi:YVTN family beta-propeller protein
LRAISIGTILVTLAACQARHVPTASPPAPSDDQATVYVFLKPHGSGELDVRLEEIRVVREDGQSVLLPLLVDRIEPRRGEGERLLAWGGIPPGHYAALGLHGRFASPGDPTDRPPVEGEAEVARAPVAFVAERSAAVVLSASLDLSATSQAGRLAPTLKAVVPDQPATSLMGFAADRQTGTVFVLDKIAGHVVRAIRTGRRPGGLAVDTARARVYVPQGGEDAIGVIDATSGTVIERIPLSGGDDPAEVVLTPGGTSLLGVNTGSGTVSVIDVRSLIETSRVTVGNGPRSILIDAAGTRAYVFNTLSDTISVIDVSAAVVVATLAADSGPLRGAFDRAQRRLYVINRSSPYLTVIDPVALSVLRRVYVGAGASALTVDPRTDRIYLARRNARAVEVFDPFSFLPVDTIPAPGDVAHLVIDREGNTLFLSLPSSHSVRAIRLVGNQAVWSADFAGEPSWVALMGER